ncbi:hypothetical protein MPH_09229 [Macrophomina phaseolina MS6]|uniref:Uncharacterized protein n=1 Tax=Macrophomina phaseolina (strain MS6) TaxID=1126212 RepID=K2S9P4_MACPH|nr:hypothetical protein MPH_09229 [Macrophomina phaseolina MS6]
MSIIRRPRSRSTAMASSRTCATIRFSPRARPPCLDGLVPSKSNDASKSSCWANASSSLEPSDTSGGADQRLHASGLDSLLTIVQEAKVGHVCHNVQPPSVACLRVRKSTQVTQRADGRQRHFILAVSDVPTPVVEHPPTCGIRSIVALVDAHRKSSEGSRLSDFLWLYQARVGKKGCHVDSFGGWVIA